MSQILLDRRVALARVEAALIQAGFSTHENVTVRVADDDPAAVAQALAIACSEQGVSGEGAIAGKPATNAVALVGLYGDPKRITHATAPAASVRVPDDIVQILRRVGDALPQSDGEMNPLEVGWRISADHGSSPASGLLLRINTAHSQRTPLRLESYANDFARAFGMPVRLEIGQMPYEQDRWAQEAHNFMATGMSIGHAAPGATITMPLRYTDQKKSQRAESATPRIFPFLTAAHPFHRPSTKLSKLAIFQPVGDTNPNRNIGALVSQDYEHHFDSVNFMDAAIVDGIQTASLSFGRDRRVLGGVHTEELTDRDRAYIYGATSGMKAVKIEYFYDVHTAMLSSDGTRIIYKDMIEFSFDENDDRPASQPGDSGAALLIRSGDRYHVAGMVVGGGGRAAGKRKPRSYAVPIQRILDRFGVTLF